MSFTSNKLQGLWHYNCNMPWVGKLCLNIMKMWSMYELLLPWNTEEYIVSTKGWCSVSLPCMSDRKMVIISLYQRCDRQSWGTKQFWVTATSKNKVHLTQYPWGLESSVCSLYCLGHSSCSVKTEWLCLWSCSGWMLML